MIVFNLYNIIILSGVSIISNIIELGDRWEEYFENPVSDYFNIDKNSVRVLFWNKNWAILKHVPDHYGPEWSIGYALIRWINCQARCHYCYLQSYFKSPDIIRFVNIDQICDFVDRFLDRFMREHSSDKQVYIYDGDYQDSLGFFGIKENIDQLNQLIWVIEKYKNVLFEIRTKAIIKEKCKDRFNKSINVKDIGSDTYISKIYDKLTISDKLIYAITFSPQDIIDKYEQGTSSFFDRLDFAKYINAKWWKIWVRIDPIILDGNNIDFCLEKYINMVWMIQDVVNEFNIQNWSLWLLRLKDDLFKKLRSRWSWLVCGMIKDWGFWRYPEKFRNYVYDKIKTEIKSNNIYICMDK